MFNIFKKKPKNKEELLQFDDEESLEQLQGKLEEIDDKPIIEDDDEEQF